MSLWGRQRTPLIERIFAGHHDVLAALRSLRRSPGFVAIAVLSLGLAIGLNTTTYALFDAIREPAIPYYHPEELFSVGMYGDGGELLRAANGEILRRRDLYQVIVPIRFDNSSG